MPEQRHSLFGGRLSDRAIVCGGNDGNHERAECFVLRNNANGIWQRMTPDLGQPLIFAAAAGKFLNTWPGRYSNSAKIQLTNLPKIIKAMMDHPISILKYRTIQILIEEYFCGQFVGILKFKKKI